MAGLVWWPARGRRNGRPIVLDRHGRLYLERFWAAERDTAAGFLTLASGLVFEPAGLDGAVHLPLRESAVEEARRGGGPDSSAGRAQPFRVLCAHRVSPYGAERFNRLVERRLRARGLAPAHDAFYPGRPILVTRNDPTRASSP